MHQSPQKICLVTCATDLGNLALEGHLTWALKQFTTVDHFQFAPTQPGFLTSPPGVLKNRVDRIAQSPALNRHLDAAHRQGLPILIFSISTALHAIPFAVRHPGRFSLMLDWTRLLQKDFFGAPISNQEKLIMQFHKFVLSKAYKILCPTDVCLGHLRQRYGTPETQLCKILMPIDLDYFCPDEWPPCPPGERVRVLFVGGNFKAKGGDLLLDWYSKEGHELCDLTIVTHAPRPQNTLPALTWKNGVDQTELRSLYRDHDVLCHPSPWHSFGLVMGEAAACGLAVITCRSALGSTELVDDGVSGTIADSPQECIMRLKAIITNRELIYNMRLAARNLMVDRYAPSKVFDRILNGLTV
ncbi:MAG: glycosyltransferase family 4 protein [Candidatus Obscuribacterales bacterium]|nr:glycosyltransferase family 4 protein [Candidatus Obscuribacterales bacterium]